MGFYNYHVHTHHSVFDSIIKEQDLIKFALDNRHDTVMVSEHGTMSGSISLYNLCKENNLKYIPAMESYYCDSVNIQDDILYHLLFFAYTTEGYKNLLRLTSKSHEYFYKKPRLDFNILKELNLNGMYCSSACLGGLIKRDDYINQFDKLVDLFNGRFIVELHCYGQSEQEQANIKLIKYAKERGLKMVIATDAHYVNKEEADTHRLWKNIKKGSDYFPDDSLFLHTEQQARETCKGITDEIFSDCVDNLHYISSICDINISDGNKHYPVYPVDDADKELRSRVKKIWLQNYPTPNINCPTQDIKYMQYGKRVKHELEVLRKLNYANYFLIVDDVLRWCRENGIATGVGRGSCCGSLICYLLGITKIDPIQYNIIFERFAHTERVSDCDIDCDVSQIHRGEVINYLKEKYGNVYNIRTYNTLKPKASVKRACMALEVPVSIANEITSTIDTSIDQAQHATPDLPKIKELAKKFEGLIANFGVHASGILVFSDDPNNYASMETQLVGNERYTVLSQEFTQLEQLGLMKLDILGLRNLDIIKETVEDTGININDIPDDDEKTFASISRGETSGCFQIEGYGMTALCKRFQPKSISDLAIIVAGFRPGSIQFLDSMINNKKNGIVYENGLMGDIQKSHLQDTYGVWIFQEQIMQIFRDYFGYSMGESDMVRRAIGKKKPEELNKIVNNCIKSHPEAKEVLDKVIASADYLFNSAHAHAYAYLSYQTAYLKTHFPLEYFKALLNSVIGDQEKTGKYVSEVRKRGIKVHTPKINKSEQYWSIKEDGLYAGYGCIKGIGQFYGVIRGFYDNDDSNQAGLRANQLENLVRSGFYTEDSALLLHELSIRGNIGKDILATKTKMNEWLGKEDSKNKERFLKQYKERLKDLQEREQAQKKNIIPPHDLAEDQIALLGFSENSVLMGYDDSECDGVMNFLAKVTEARPHVMKNGKNMLFINVENEGGERRLVLFREGDIKVGGVYQFRMQKENIIWTYKPAKKLIE